MQYLNEKHNTIQLHTSICLTILRSISYLYRSKFVPCALGESKLTCIDTMQPHMGMCTGAALMSRGTPKHACLQIVQYI